MIYSGLTGAYSLGIETSFLAVMDVDIVQAPLLGSFAFLTESTLTGSFEYALSGYSLLDSSNSIGYSSTYSGLLSDASLYPSDGLTSSNLYSAINFTGLTGSFSIQPIAFSGLVSDNMMLGFYSTGLLGSFVIQDYHKGYGGLVSGFAMPEANYKVVNYDDHKPQLVFNGNLVEISPDVSLSNAAGSSGFSCSVQVLDNNDYQLLKSGTMVTLFIGTEPFVLMVGGGSSSKSGVDARQLSLDLVPPLYQYQSPYSIGMSKVWDTPTMASAIVESLIGPVDWQIVDWLLPAYRLGVENTTPLDIVKQVVAAAGAYVENNPDGSVRVCYDYPDNMHELDPVLLDDFQILDSLTTVLTSDDDYRPSSGENRFLVYDTSVDNNYDSDRLEFEVYDPTSGLLSAYPSPLRAITITHTAPEALSITDKGSGDYIDLVIVDDVEIVAGSGSVSKPIYGIVSVEYLSIPLTGLSYDDGGTSLKTGNEAHYGLVRISYTTRVRQFNVTGAVSEKVQFLMGDA